MTSPPRLPRKPEARTEKVEDLVERVRRGLVRVPQFQRGLKWQSSDVAELFDSIYRGYPIGSLLFYKRPAKADRILVGSLVVQAPEIQQAWWVVDGQQRVTALTAALMHPLPLPARPTRDDPYALFFDPEEQTFEPPPATGKLPSTWVPLPHLLDGSHLSQWIFDWKHREHASLRKVVFDAGSRLRDYSIPLYLIEPEHDDIAKLIFYRINNAGRSLQWEDVHKALFRGTGESPSTLGELAEDLREVGMGRIEERRLLTCLVSLRGKDPTRTLAEHDRRDPEVLRNAVQEALPVLRRVLSFLRADAGIPHIRLLPKSILLDILTRFFALHSDPTSRTRILLARWFWRTVLGAGVFNDRTLRRRGISAVGDDAEESVQSLLALARKERPRPFELPDAFDARADQSRIVLLALAHLRPCELRTGEPIDIAALLEREGQDAFARIVKQSPAVAMARSPANRIVQAKGTPILQLIAPRASSNAPDDSVLASHVLDAQAVSLIIQGDAEEALRRRGQRLVEEVKLFSERMAAWDYSDRPSVDHILEEAGIEL